MNKVIFNDFLVMDGKMDLCLVLGEFIISVLKTNTCWPYAAI